MFRRNSRIVGLSATVAVCVVLGITVWRFSAVQSTRPADQNLPVIGKENVAHGPVDQRKLESATSTSLAEERHETVEPIAAITSKPPEVAPVLTISANG